CIDTQTIRWVVSPKINTYPYVEDFENSAGNWFAESRDSSHRLLWEWGVDSDQRGIPSDNSNHIWTTQGNDAYKAGESAWVYSPCFDISSLDRPMISLDYWNHTRLPFDGAVIEYQMADGSWAPLGSENRGIDWFNTSFIAGEPGGDSNRVFHLGWSGESDHWQNGRYKLDDFRGNNDVLRMRVAFASLNNIPQYFFDGFAFDNVVVKNRTRNVLLETTIHDRHTNMLDINNKTYGLVYSLRHNIFKDVILLQHPIEYSKEIPSVNNANTIRDFFFEQNETLSRNNIAYENLGETRVFEYGNEKAGRAYINGDNPIYLADSLSESTFDKDMLQDPKFEIKINHFIHNNSKFKVEASIKALEPFDSTVRVYVVISEDQLYYPANRYYGANNALNAMARISSTSLNRSSNNPNTFMQSWSVGQLENIDFEWDYTLSPIINYRPNKFHAVVFAQNISTKEIYQVATSRVNSGYWVGINPIQAEEELNELQSLKLFPNPAHDYFNLQFDQALKHDYEWKLVNMQGVEVQQGHIQMGTDQVRIDGLDYPSGAYILLLYNNNVFVQRKVILGRP
ncbi:MAG: T9SS type A sorting domain-containing protein, partial [Aureispira sp.]